MELDCYGCSIESMSQRDHMGCGGCLHNIQSCEFCLILNLEKKINKDNFINEGYQNKKYKKNSR